MAGRAQLTPAGLASPSGCGSRGVEAHASTTPRSATAIYAQWSDRAEALEWLDTAMRLRDPGLSELKGDPLIDPLRKEPRFQAMMRELRFAD